MRAPGFDLQGHRGARGLFPENTLEGFAAAIALGVRAFELDVAVTRDGVVVLSHDPALNPDLTRGPDGPGRRPRGASRSRARATTPASRRSTRCSRSTRGCASPSN